MGSCNDEIGQTLVQRLRELARSEHDDADVADEAADEIERLRDELHLCCELKRTYQEQLAAERERCAKIAEDMDYSPNGAIARCIRAVAES